MLIGIRTCGVVLLLGFSSLIVSFANAQPSGANRRWKGYAILGSGHLTAVYSDDPRITCLTHQKGIQHFYFGDYTADYVASTSFDLLNRNGQPMAPSGDDAVGMKNFFTTQTRTPLANGSLRTVLCFVHQEDAAVLSLNASGAGAKSRYKFQAVLKKEVQTDRRITLTSLHEKDNIAIAIWSNGTALAVVPKAPHDKVGVTSSSVVVTGSRDNQPHAEVLLIPATSAADAIAKARAFRQKADIEAEATKHWNAWMNAGVLPVFQLNDPMAGEYLEAYKRNIYCVKAANLNGQIPADITGQFVTNQMPQLYPRDAMMCARVLLLTGHLEEARQVIEFWANKNIPMKTVGEWYARYDANAKPVDAGSGARFDEPEWDANGYYIYLLTEYHRLKGVWLASPTFIYELADFLVSHISSNGLLQEGGIVEWTGYLPATNMICSAALQSAARIAREFGNEQKAVAYTATAQRITAALPEMFDTTRQTYADVRSASKKGEHGESIAGQPGEKTYLWDTTANVGLLWGYPDHRAIQLSNAFYEKNTVKLGGGVQYFDTPDAGLAEYGHDVFFFTTAAAAQVQAHYRRHQAAKGFVDWMLRNANSYGLMPERIHLDGKDCSPASPLSWCCAEFAAAVLLLSRL
jgi:GH15 family glucan-1,4-alpha-glucosidase